MLTSCGFLEDVVNAITPPDGNDASNEVVLPDYKDFGDDPYRIEIKDGVAVVDFNPCCVEPFVLEIPETDENGNPVPNVSINLTGTIPETLPETGDSQDTEGAEGEETVPEEPKPLLQKTGYCVHCLTVSAWDWALRSL
jgi:hypothetical protein